MTDRPANPAASPNPAAAPPVRLISLDDLEQAWQRQAGPFLQDVKQMTLQMIEDLGRKHGSPVVAHLRQTLVDTVGAALKTQEAALWAQLKPALEEGGDSVRKKTEDLLENLKQFVAKTVVEVFRGHVPEYSRWAGQRVLDYFLAGTLFCLAAVLLCVGGILALEHAGFPPYATYLVTGAAALVLGLALLKLRSRRWSGGLGGKDLNSS